MNTEFFTCHNTAIRQYANAIWQMEGIPSYSQETILPKGVIELIFSFSDAVAFGKCPEDQKTTTPRCFVNGMNNRPLYVNAPSHQFFFGIEINPLAVKKILAVPPGRFLNSVTDLTLISKDFSSLWQQLGEACCFKQRVDIIYHWIEKKLSVFCGREIAFSSYLNNELPAASVTDLAGRFCYSVRQLHRKANDLFGMPTESLVIYKRYLSSLKMLHHSSESLTGIGYECGFYDQAHFIREFKNYTGITPGAYRQQKSNRPAHLYR